MWLFERMTAAGRLPVMRGVQQPRVRGRRQGLQTTCCGVLKGANAGWWMSKHG